MVVGPIELVHAVAALLAAMIPVGLLGGKTVKDNRDRSRRNNRMLTGDSADPNVEGVLQIAHDTYQKVEELDESVEEVRFEAKENRQIILQKLEEMNGEHEMDDFDFEAGDD